MKEPSQNLLRKVALLGVLGGMLWGTSLAAETSATQQATTSPNTVGTSVSMKGPQQMALESETNTMPTAYDDMVQARSMAHNQVEANAAIFLMPNTSYGASRTNAGHMPTDYDRKAHHSQERQYQPDKANGDTPERANADTKVKHSQERHEGKHVNSKKRMPPMGQPSMNGDERHQGMPPMGQPSMNGDERHQGMPLMGQPLINGDERHQGMTPMGQPPMNGFENHQGMPPMMQSPMAGPQGSDFRPPMPTPPRGDRMQQDRSSQEEQSQKHPQASIPEATF